MVRISLRHLFALSLSILGLFLLFHNWHTTCQVGGTHLPHLQNTFHPPKYARADKSVSRLLWMEQVSDYWKHHRLHEVTLQLDLEIWRRLLVFSIGENSPALQS